MPSTQRRINSTGRNKINREDIEIVIQPPAIGEPLAATVLLRTDNWKYPSDARIILEAYHRNSGMRFDCGNIAKPDIPGVLKLDELDPSSAVLFRLKIVDGVNGSGKILASAERIRPGESDNSAGRRSIFPILTRDLNDELAKVDISDAGPVLILNCRVSGFITRLLEDPLLAGTLLPFAFRNVITHISIEGGSHSDDDDAWTSDWIEFCKKELEIDDPTELKTEEDQDNWIDTAVSSFCRKHDFIGKTLKAFKEVI